MQKVLFRTCNKSAENSFLPHKNEYTVETGKFALPTLTGLRFISKAELVCLRHQAGDTDERAHWTALLYDQDEIKLRNRLAANQILTIINDALFIKISHGCIVNLLFVDHVDYKTNRCILNKPFDNLILPISRKQLNELRKQFDKL